MNIINITFFYNQYNYGQRLQAYALQAYLKNEFNVSVGVIDSRGTERDFTSFEDDLMRRTEVELGALETYLPRIDAIIYGGDQIWNTDYSPESHIVSRIHYPLSYKAVHLPYSASINASGYFFNSKMIMDTLTRSEYISTRERQDADRLNARFREMGINKVAEWHIDPALLLKRCDYEKISRKPDREIVEPFNFRYTVESRVDDRVENGIQTYNEMGNDVFPPRYTHLDPREWIWMVQHYQKLITSSFHGFVFGLLFNKRIEFETNYRIQNLIDILGIRFRNGVIENYDEVIGRLNQERARSRKYFETALSKIEEQFNGRAEYCAYSGTGRDLSTSGGISAELAKSVFSRKNGIVYGAAYSRDFRSVNIIPVTNMTDYYRHIAGSKYSVSTMPKFRNVKDSLDSGKFVMFTGCPCQIKALKTYLNRDYENLLLVDLLCSGVSSNKVLSDAIEKIEKEHGSKVISFNMRFNHRSVTWYLLENGESGTIQNVNSYEHFINSCRLENCKKCNMHMGSGVSDITIGDFWNHYNNGRVNDQKFSPDIGTNWVIINSQRGFDFFSGIRNNIECLRIR